MCIRDRYHTYFLNMVDEADLLAALEAAGGELPACSCTEKCAPGAINTDCEVCAVNMTECAAVSYTHLFQSRYLSARLSRREN